MPRLIAVIVLSFALVPASASAFEGGLAGVPAVHHGRASLPLLSHGSVRTVRLVRGWRIVHGTVRLDLGALRIGDVLRVPRTAKRVVVVRRGTVVSFRALSKKLAATQSAAADASSALNTFVGSKLDRAGAEALRASLNTVDAKALALADELAASRGGIVAVAGPARDADLVGRLQAAEDAARSASPQLEQAVTQLDDALSLLPGLSLPLQSVSAVPALATSALTALKQSLPPVGNLLQAVLAGGG